jgi:hypothetical protein
MKMAWHFGIRIKLPDRRKAEKRLGARTPGYSAAFPLSSAHSFLHHMGDRGTQEKCWKFIAKARNVDVVFLVRRLSAGGAKRADLHPFPLSVRFREP